MGYKIGLSQKRKQKLEAELQRIILDIIKLGVEKIILFGSLSSGDVHKSSDIDLIIVKKTEKKFLERLEEFYNYLNPHVAVDILVYTPEEFEEMKKNNPFIMSALNQGRIIYERKEEKKEIAKRWFLQALRDLDDAKFNFSGERFNVACFLAQQSA